MLIVLLSLVRLRCLRLSMVSSLWVMVLLKLLCDVNVVRAELLLLTLVCSLRLCLVFLGSFISCLFPNGFTLILVVRVYLAHPVLCRWHWAVGSRSCVLVGSLLYRSLLASLFAGTGRPTALCLVLFLFSYSFSYGYHHLGETLLRRTCLLY